jgi:hypothetical protein
MYTEKNYTVESWPETHIARAGYRVGEFFNPIFATYITALTRIKIADGCNKIVANGGKPIVIMTDSILWEGNETDLPSELYRDIKTVGYFEKPKHVQNIVCLGSGRYGYEADGGFITAKRRGLNAVEFHTADGVIIDDINWLKALKVIKKYNTDKLKVKVRSLISVGMILGNSKYKMHDLGRIVEEMREIDLVVGRNKRFFKEALDNPRELSERLFETEPIHLATGMFGNDQINDQTLPELRDALMKMEVITQDDKTKATDRNCTKRHKEKYKEKISQERKSKYDYIRSKGYDSKEATKMSYWSLDKIELKLMEDNKL